MITYVVLGIAVAIGGFFFWRSQMAEKESEAQGFKVVALKDESDAEIVKVEPYK